MNISHKHKTIWWAPERCGTKATAHIFRHFDFDYTGVLGNKDLPKSAQYQSHELTHPSNEYSDYNVICSIRNPYDRMLGIFLYFVSSGKSSVYFKDKHNLMVDNFTIFINELFSYKEIKPKFGIESKRKKVILNNYISKYNFDVTIPSNFIRMENIVEDISKINFIKDSPLLSSGYIGSFLSKNTHINVRPYKFNSLYTMETAKKVYEYHKQFFLILGYDPFSFTTEELTNEEKMRFLHEII
jgi:hypothetical protein